MELKDITKKVNLELVGLDGNAFNLMGQFKKQAQRENWTKEEIDTVLEECHKSNYDHLLATLVQFCEKKDEDGEDNGGRAEAKDDDLFGDEDDEDEEDE